MADSRSRSRSPKRERGSSVSKKSPSRKSSRERDNNDKDRNGSSSRRNRRRRSSSASSTDRHRRKSRSRSRSRRRSRSRSPYYRSRNQRTYDRDNPPASNVLGVFGLSYNTNEQDLEREFGRYGTLENIRIVRDPENRSRGFGFIDFKHMDDAKEARRALCDKILDGKKIRVDYSLTKEPHGRTPGQYLGNGRWNRRSPPSRYHHRRRSRSYSPLYRKY